MVYNPREFESIRNTALSIGLLAWVLLLAGAGAEEAHSHHDDHLAAGTRHAVHWFAMLCAMMAPGLTAEIHHVRSSSLARRRGRSTFLFAAGYFGVWSAVGGVLLVIVAALRASALPAAITLAAALVWQCSPFKQWCLNRCHEQAPLAVFGSAADWSALRYGAMHGVWCVGSCWLWMLWPMFVPGGHLAAMALASALVYCERLEHPKPPRWQCRGFGRATRLLVARAVTLVRA